MIISYFCPGKSKVAHDLAQHYGGACLTVDSVVTDVLMNGSSAVSLRARQLYDAAAAQYSEKKAKEPGKHRKNHLLQTEVKQLWAQLDVDLAIVVVILDLDTLQNRQKKNDVSKPAAACLSADTG